MKRYDLNEVNLKSIEREGLFMRLLEENWVKFFNTILLFWLVGWNYFFNFLW